MTPTYISPGWYQQRRHELDWLRVLAFFLLILYHAGMAYVADWSWHIKSDYQSEWLQNLMLWTNQWRMSLLFLISGAAVSYQLHRNSGGRFLLGSVRKLFLPLLFGSLVVVAPQPFVELKTQGSIPEMGYLTFWRDYLGYPFGFGKSLPSGYGRLEPTNITWNHLWYLAYLLVYIFVLWAIYPLLKEPAVGRFAHRIGQRLHPSALFILPIALLYAIGQLLWERFPTTYMLVNDWHSNARYFLVFFLGFLLVRSNRLWGAIKSLRRLSLSLALASYAGILFYRHGGEVGAYLGALRPVEIPLRELVWSANSWLWILAILGYAQAWLNRPNRHLQAANRGVYCYYMVHQTLIVLSLYWIGRYSLGPALEPLVLVTIVAAGCAVSFWLIKPVPYVRGLMGIFEVKSEREPNTYVARNSRSTVV